MYSNHEISQNILNALPYGKNFTFVDEIIFINENRIQGSYFFSREAEFYKEHFKHEAITPGVLILESMAQIGLVCHGIFLLNLYSKRFFPAFSHVETEFFSSIPPDTHIEVIANKIYCRNKIIKSNIELYNAKSKKLVAKSIALGKFIIEKQSENE
jgi:3-hydroxyacyl-[acyl-carrier-protein] dehydratase